MATNSSQLTVHTDQILTISCVYSFDECASLIELAEGLGFAAADVRTKTGPRMEPSIRNNERVNMNDVAIANELWQRIEEFVPVHGDAEPVGVDSSLRFYKYTGDQRFKRHKDGVADGPDGYRSRYSCLLYLNDNFEGGETAFTIIGENKSREVLSIRPVTGTVLLFIHNLWHEGVPVANGVKYVLRTDVFFRED